MGSEIASAFVRIRPDMRGFKSETEVGVKSAFSSAFRNAAKIAGGAFAAAGLAEAIKHVAEAASEHQAAFAVLDQTLKNAGLSAQGFSADLHDILEQEARLKGFSSEQLASSMVRLVSVTKDVPRALADLRSAEDLSRARHIDLATAALALSKAEQGSLTALQRYGIIVPKVGLNVAALTKEHDAATAAGVKFTGVLKQQYDAQLAAATAADVAARKTEVFRIIQQRFGGSAATFANTAAGQFARLGEDIKQFEIGIGTAIIPTLAGAAEALQRFFSAAAQNEGLREGLGNALHSIGSALSFVAEAGRVAGPVLGEVARDAAALVAAVGSPAILSALAVYKGIPVVMGLASAAQARYIAIASRGAGVSAADAAAKGEDAGASDALAGSLVALTGALEANTVALGEAAAVGDVYAASLRAQGVAAVAAAAETEAATAATVAGSTGIRAFGAGLAALVNPYTIALAGAAALAGGIAYLATREDNATRTTRNYRDAVSDLDKGLQHSADLRQHLADVTASVPSDVAALKQAKLNVEMDRNALATTTAAHGSFVYRQLVIDLQRDTAGLAQSLNQLARDQTDVTKTGAGLNSQNRANIAGYAGVVKTIVAVRDNVRDANKQWTILESRRPLSAGDKLQHFQDSVRSFSQKLAEGIPGAKTDAALKHSLDLLTEFALVRGRLATDREISIALNLRDPKATLDDFLEKIQGKTPKAAAASGEQGVVAGKAWGVGYAAGIDSTAGLVNGAVSRLIGGASRTGANAPTPTAPFRRASGGPVPGSGTTDSVAALLTPQEVVFNNNQQRTLRKMLGLPQYGSALDLFNYVDKDAAYVSRHVKSGSDTVQAFQTGGVVSAMPGASSSEADSRRRAEYLRITRGIAAGTINPVAGQEMLRRLGYVGGVYQPRGGQLPSLPSFGQVAHGVASGVFGPSGAVATALNLGPALAALGRTPSVDERAHPFQNFFRGQTGLTPRSIYKILRDPLGAAAENRRKFEESGYRSSYFSPTDLILTQTGIGVGLRGEAPLAHDLIPSLTDILGDRPSLRATDPRLARRLRGSSRGLERVGTGVAGMGLSRRERLAAQAGQLDLFGGEVAPLANRFAPQGTRPMSEAFRPVVGGLHTFDSLIGSGFWTHEELLDEFDPAVKQVFANIDRVHGFPAHFPNRPIPVVPEKDAYALGHMLPTSGAKLMPAHIAFRPNPEMGVGPSIFDASAWTLTHEAGHALDFSALKSSVGRLRPGSAEVGGDAGWTRFWQEIQASGSVQRMVTRLTELQRLIPSNAVNERQRRVLRGQKKGLEYLLNPREMFARAYQQWITEKTGIPALRAGMVTDFETYNADPTDALEWVYGPNVKSGGPMSRAHFAEGIKSGEPIQSFAGISSAMDSLFSGRGLLHDQVRPPRNGIAGASVTVRAGMGLGGKPLLGSGERGEMFTFADLFPHLAQPDPFAGQLGPFDPIKPIPGQLRLPGMGGIVRSRAPRARPVKARLEPPPWNMIASGTRPLNEVFAPTLDGPPRGFFGIEMTDKHTRQFVPTLQELLAMMDTVHGWPNWTLPGRRRIPIRPETKPNLLGHVERDTTTVLGGRRLSQPLLKLGRGVFVRPKYSRYANVAGMAPPSLMELMGPTFVHEFGHVLDYEVLRPNLGALNATSEIAAAQMKRGLVQPELQAMADVLEAYGATEEMKFRNANEYMLRPREQFARAYGQYMIHKLGDQRLLKGLVEEARGADKHNAGWYIQPFADWKSSPPTPVADRLLANDNPTFAPTSAAIDKLLAERGLLHPTARAGIGIGGRRAGGRGTLASLTGDRVFYHGRRRNFEGGFKKSFADEDALYGPGFYFTSDQKIANSYATGESLTANGRRFFGPQKNFFGEFDLRDYLADNEHMLPLTTRPDRVRSSLTGDHYDVTAAEFLDVSKERPNVRMARLDVKNPFDVEAPLTHETIDKIAATFERRNASRPYRETPYYSPRRNPDANKRARRFQPGMDVSEFESEIGLLRGYVNESREKDFESKNKSLYHTLEFAFGKTEANRILKGAGFDSIKYPGGEITGVPGHEVYVLFDGKQIRAPFGRKDAAGQTRGAIGDTAIAGMGAAGRTRGRGAPFKTLAAADFNEIAEGVLGSQKLPASLSRLSDPRAMAAAIGRAEEARTFALNFDPLSGQWYRTTATRDIVPFAEREGISPLQGVDALALWSPQATPLENMVKAATTARQFLFTQREFGHGFIDKYSRQQGERMEALMRGEPWGDWGIKTTNYRSNNGQWLAPKKDWQKHGFDAQAVTNDRWVAAMNKTWLRGQSWSQPKRNLFKLGDSFEVRDVGRAAGDGRYEVWRANGRKAAQAFPTIDKAKRYAQNRLSSLAQTVEDKEYPVFTDMFRRHAARVGELPQETQAAPWITYRSRDLMRRFPKAFPTMESAFADSKLGYQPGLEATKGPLAGLLPGGHLAPGGMSDPYMVSLLRAARGGGTKMARAGTGLGGLMDPLSRLGLPRSEVLASVPGFRLERVASGDPYREYTGEDSTMYLERGRRKRLRGRLDDDPGIRVAYNLKDKLEQVRGSISMMWKPDETYVEQVYLDDELRTTTLARDLLNIPLSRGKPVTGHVINPKLLRVAQRLQQRGANIAVRDATSGPFFAETTAGIGLGPVAARLGRYLGNVAAEAPDFYKSEFQKSFYPGDEFSVAQIIRNRRSARVARSGGATTRAPMLAGGPPGLTGLLAGHTPPGLPLGRYGIGSEIGHDGPHLWTIRGGRGAENPIPMRRNISGWLEQFVGRGLSRAQERDAARWWGAHWPAQSRFAVGGPVPGHGGGDTVAAMLTPGELILNRGQQQNLGAMLGMRDASAEQLFSKISGSVAHGRMRGGRLHFAGGGTSPDFLGMQVDAATLGGLLPIPGTAASRSGGTASTSAAADHLAKQLRAVLEAAFPKMKAELRGMTVQNLMQLYLEKALGLNALSAAAYVKGKAVPILQKAFDILSKDISSGVRNVVDTTGVGYTKAVNAATKNLKDIRAAAKDELSGLKDDLVSMQQSLKDAIKQETQDVTDSVNSAKSNLNSIGQSITATVTAYLNKPLDDAQNRLSRLGNLNSLEQLRRSVILPGNKTLSKDPEKAAAQLEALAKKPGTNQLALRDFATRYETASLAVRRDRVNATTTRLGQNFNDLTYEANTGEISAAQYKRRVQRLLGAQRVTPAAIRRRLGEAAAGTFVETENAAFAQARAIAASPQRAGSGLGPTVIHPLEVLHRDQQQIHDLQKQIGNQQIKIQKAIHEETKKTAAATATLAKAQKAKDKYEGKRTAAERNPGRTSKRNRDLNGGSN